MSMSWRYYDYLRDTIYCWLYGVWIRLDRNDIKILIIWFSVSLIMLIMSIIIHYLLIFAYALSVFMMWLLTKKYRDESALNSKTENVIEIMKYDVSDTEKTIVLPVIVGQWIGKRNHMEDEYFICPKQKLFGVFDGHGGCATSLWIKHNFADQYEEIFNDLLFEEKDPHDPQSIDHIITSAIEKTMIQMDCDSYDIFLKSMRSGAVGVCLKIHSDKIYCSFIGDSGACILTHDDKIITLTKSHTMYNFDEYCRYRDIMDPKYPKRGVILRTHSGLMPTRTIGDANYKEIDQGIDNTPESMIYNHGSTWTEFIPYNWKMIVIATDGIWDCFTPKQLIDMIRVNESNDLTETIIKIQKITTKTPDLIDKLTGKYYGDNCTIMCIMNSAIKN